jgi:hypothetical protein
MPVNLRKRKNGSLLRCRGIVILGLGCWRLWLTFYSTAVAQRFEADTRQNLEWNNRPNTKKIQVFDHELGPAVTRNKFFSFHNRPSNRGHNRSDWEALTTSSCDTTGEAKFLSREEIQSRKLPQAILIGTQKGGTTALHSYLRQHPDVDFSAKELYVLDEKMDYFFLKNPSAIRIPMSYGRKIYSKATLHVGRYTNHNRQAITNAHRFHGSMNTTTHNATSTQAHHQRKWRYSKRNRSARMHQQTVSDFAMEHLIKARESALKEHTLGDLTVLDMTPNYMIHSDRIPARIACLVPWVKIFVLLRDPVERARSQYGMKLRDTKNQAGTGGELKNIYGNPVPTFDEYIQNDIDALYEIGVFQDWSVIDFESFWTSDSCVSSWQTYIHYGFNAPVGMGLYALQLKPFLDMLSSLGKSENFFAIDSQDLRDEPDKTFNRLLDFLELKRMSLDAYDYVNQAGKKMSVETIRRHALSEDTLQNFQKAVAPYNEKLVEVLGEEWRDKWMY